MQPPARPPIPDPRSLTPGPRSLIPGPRPLLFFAGAALIALLLYLPTLQYDFVWDDGLLIQKNSFLDQTNPLELFTKGFWYNPEMNSDQGEMAYYRPLTNLSFYLERKEWGVRPMGYHLTSVVINAAVVFLVCLVLWELFGSVWLAALGGLVVGIHPAMNCIVTFISNRTYLLAMFFLLLSFYSLLRGERAGGNPKFQTLNPKPETLNARPRPRNPGPPESSSRLWRTLFACSFLLSLLALEAALVFVALAAGWLLVRRARYRSLRVWLALTVLPVVIYFLLRLGIAHVAFASSVVRWAIGDPLRVINTFGQQMQLLLFPFNHRVIYVVTEEFSGFSVYTVLGIVFLGLPLYAIIRQMKSPGSSPRVKLSARLEAGGLSWFGYAWIVLFLLPFAHLVFLGPAGRILYLTAPGLLILSYAFIRQVRPASRTLRVTAWVLAGLYVAAFAVQTLRRNPMWRNEFDLYQAMVREAPESAGAHLNFGTALAGAGRKDEAIAHYRAAIELNPDYVGPHDQLAFALLDQGDMAGAIPELREVVRLQPESPDARNNLALALKRSGQLDSAIVEYQAAIRLDPNSALTLNNLGSAYLAHGDFGQAIATLHAALRLQPGFQAARSNLAEAFRGAGMPDSAAVFEK
jgi:tetratricopeptide (TPR) repeat protein